MTRMARIEIAIAGTSILLRTIARFPTSKYRRRSILVPGNKLDVRSAMQKVGQTAAAQPRGGCVPHERAETPRRINFACSPSRRRRDRSSPSLRAYRVSRSRSRICEMKFQILGGSDREEERPRSRDAFNATVMIVCNVCGHFIINPLSLA